MSTMTSRRDDSPRRSTGSTIIPLMITTFIYFLSIGIYLHPLTMAPTPSEPPNNTHVWTLIHSPKPQLDEMHIMSTNNHDISPQPTSSWTDAWHNDYWGRPLNGESSHKSWRPVSVWSFRFGKGGNIGRRLIAIVGKVVGEFVEGILGRFERGFRSGGETYTGAPGGMGELASELFVHRFVNVMIHAAIVQIVGAVATLLFCRNSSPNRERSYLQLCTKYIPQLLFAIHPVHVEAVANVANRPHILALLFSTTMVDPNVPLVAVAILAVLALLTAETAIFQVPAIVLTMTAIRYRELTEKNGSSSNKSSKKKEKLSHRSPIMKTIITLLPRYILLVLTSTTYLLYRHYNDTLSIPDGLIRPAENPFYDKLDKNEWSLGKRTMNYSYILSLHIMKSFGVEIVGFSHEYGFDCIPEIESFRDDRLLLPTALVFFFAVVAAWSWYGWKLHRGGKRAERRRRAHRILLVLVFFSWMATLFPIAGVLKVGTFVADRVAVASSFGSCVFAGRLLAVWIAPGADETGEDARGRAKSPERRALPRVVAFLYLCANLFAGPTHRRAAAWMDSVPLLESSLEACPRSIKSNLEMSKIYSGLSPHMLDLERSVSLIRTAQSIDPTYCDVHQQYAHNYIKQSKFIHFEEEMVQSLLCPFTMGQAMDMWNKYWKVVLGGGQDEEVRRRYETYMKTIKGEVQKAEKEGRKQSNSGRVGGVEEEL